MNTARGKPSAASAARSAKQNPPSSGKSARGGDVEREVRVGLIGFGKIGTGVVKLLQRNQSQIRARLGARLSLVRIADIDLKTDRGVRIDRKLLTSNAETLIDDPSV